MLCRFWVWKWQRNSRRINSNAAIVADVALCSQPTLLESEVTSRKEELRAGCSQDRRQDDSDTSYRRLPVGGCVVLLANAPQVRINFEVLRTTCEQDAHKTAVRMTAIPRIADFKSAVALCFQPTLLESEVIPIK